MHDAGQPVGFQCSSRARSVSSQASRVWITIGLRASAAISICCDEHGLLHLARREIVVIIQSDLAHRYDLWMPQQLRQVFVSFGGSFRGIVRMHADRRQEAGVAIRQPKTRFQIGRTASPVPIATMCSTPASSAR